MKRAWLVLKLGILALETIVHVMDYIKHYSHVMMIDIEVAVCHRGLEGVTEMFA